MNTPPSPAGAYSPQLKIKVFGQPGEDFCELARAGYLFGLTDRKVMVDGQRITSYDELLQVAGRQAYCGRQYIEVTLLPTLAGG